VTGHYLDHASTSPTRPEAAAATIEALQLGGADPGRLHQPGAEARYALEEARTAVADLVGCRPRSVVFTSGATEAAHTAVWGAVERGGRIVCPVVEHSAVREASAKWGREVVDIGVDSCGRVDPDEVAAAIDDDTALVHIQWGNHEVGTLQPVADVVEACRQRRVLVHVDAAQAVGHVPVDFEGLGADLLSLSGHKFGAPPGTGALLVRPGLRLRPMLSGGEQERARRAGLENGPAIAGLAAAARNLATGRLEHEQREARRHSDRLAQEATALEGVTLHGDPEDRLPHIVCLGIEGIEPQAVLLGLDRAQVFVHSGSSCASESIEPSPVLAAMGAAADRSLRVSVGWNTTDAEVDAFLAALPEVLADLRALAAAPGP
jgi:cysteine desulfurase